MTQALCQRPYITIMWLTRSSSMSRQSYVNQRLYAIMYHGLNWAVWDKNMSKTECKSWLESVRNLTNVVENDQELFFGEAIEVLGLVQHGIQAAPIAVLHRQNKVLGRHLKQLTSLLSINSRQIRKWLKTTINNYLTWKYSRTTVNQFLFATTSFHDLLLINSG